MRISSPGVAVVVLAGGEGSRIGGAKPTRMVAGTTLIDRSLKIAKSWSDEIAIAVRSPDQIGQTDACTIADAEGVEGPLAGLIASLRWAKTRREALLTIPCDMPFLPWDLPDRLVAGLGESMAAVAASGDRLHPVCALWRVEALSLSEDYAASGRRSLHGFAEHVGFSRVMWPDVPRDPFFNVNSASDLAVAEAALGA